MIRWWDDPDAARIVLAAVDDSDVVQGVGTASLGLHALAKAALEPLLGATLVDRVDVAAVLEHLPLEPVSKALAEATRPLLSEAADRYGVLLATELSHQARDGASAMVQALTARGLPMPLAVARAAEVAGLPPNRIGPYVEAMKDPATSVLVVADAADRALMGYAQALGLAEANGEEAVAKEMRFRERDHPRDVEGRFAEKGEEADPRRKARMARRARRDRRDELTASQVPTPAQAKSGTLMDLVRAMRPTQPAQAEVERERPRPLAALAQQVKAPAKKQQPRQRKAPATTAATGARTRGWLGLPTGKITESTFDYRDATDRFVPVPKEWVTGSGGLLDGGLSTSRLAEMLGGDMTGYKATDLEALRAEADKLQGGRHNPADWVMLRLPPDTPVHDTEGSGVDQALGWVVPRQAEFRASNYESWKTNWHPFEDARYRQVGLPYDQYEQRHGVDIRPSYRVVDLEVANKDVLDKHLKGSVGKAEQVEHWNVGGHALARRVARDEHGEFAASGGEADVARRQRMARRARRNRRAELNESQAAALRPVVIPNEASLLELVAALRPVQAKAPTEAERERPRPKAALTELATEAKSGKRAQTAPKAATEEKAATGFGHQTAMLLTQGEMSQLFGFHEDFDFLGRGHEIDVVTEPDMKGYGGQLAAPKPVLEAIEDLDTLHRQYGRKVGPPLDSMHAVAHWKRKHELELSAQRERARYHPEEHAAPRGQEDLVWTRNNETGVYQAYVASEPVEQRYLIYGDPAAIKAAFSRDQDTMLHLRQVAEDTHSLATREGVHLSDVSPSGMVRPVIAIHVEASGGEQLNDLPPRGKAPR